MSKQLIFSNNLNLDDSDPNVNNEKALAELSLDDELFIEAKEEEIAILLVDVSGSTRLKFHTGVPIGANSFHSSVFGKQYEIIKNLPHNRFYILFWCSVQDEGRYATGVRLSDSLFSKESLEYIFKNEYTKITDKNLTDTSLAFKRIPEAWLKDTKTIYLITDGEICVRDRSILSVKSDIKASVESLQCMISILTVENNAPDYTKNVENNSFVGCDVYKAIQENNLTKHIRKFVTYSPGINDDDMKSYTHINKIVAPVGYIPYGDKYFLEINMDKFVQSISNELKGASDSEQLVIAQKLSSTLSVLLKNKSQLLVDYNIRMFSRLFSIDNQAIYYIIGDSLIADQKGRAEIMTEYYAKLRSFYADAQKKLVIDVSRAIGLESHFCSYPIYDNANNVFRVLLGPAKLATDSIKLSGCNYPRSSVKTTTVFCVKYDDLTEFNKQCLRQWTRTNYSMRFPVKSVDDIIVYMVLLEMLSINNSEVDSVTKLAYKNLSRVMLEKKRNKTSQTELGFLLEGNMPNTEGYFSEFLAMIGNAAKMLNIIGPPVHLWHDAIQALNDIVPGLYDAQKIHCIKYGEFNDEYKMSFPKYQQDVVSNTSVYDYSCYITMDNLTDVGGYIFKSHITPTNAECSPIFMLSEVGMQSLIESGNMICPVCYSHLDIDSYEKVPPQIVTVLPDIYTNRSNNIIAPKKTTRVSGEVKDCYLIIMRGTVGAGKSTLAEFIEKKYTGLGFKVYNEGTDKYCVKGISPRKAITYVQRVLNNAATSCSKTIVIVDTCGDNRNPRPFGANFDGWKTIELWPNYDKDNKLGYLSWSLTNVLNRKKFGANSNYYLSPYSEAVLADGIKLCIHVHYKKAQALGLYDNTFSKLSDTDRLALANKYAETIKPCEFDISKV
jgi:hypothetical protein